MEYITKYKIAFAVLLVLIILVVSNYSWYQDGLKKGKASVQKDMFEDLIKYKQYNYFYTNDNQTLMLSLIPSELACGVCQLQINSQNQNG